MLQSSSEPAYGVFQDEQRHTCIRLAESKAGYTYIPWDNVGLAVHKLPRREFEKRYVLELTDYPLKKAATSFLGATWVEATEEARKCLEFIKSGKFKEINKLINFENKEYQMPAKEKAAAPKKVAAKPAATAPKKVEAPKKVAAKPSASAIKPLNPTKVATPAPAKAAPKNAAKPRGRSSVYVGKKITLLSKENPKRTGSASYARFALYKTGMTVEAFVAAGGTMGDVDYDSKHKFISVA